MSKYVIFSFDDGRKDQYDVAYKILKKYNFPATINIVSEFINNEKLFQCFKTMNNKSLSWDNLYEMEQEGKWEIACHGATHQNTVDDIKAWLKDVNVLKNKWNINVGFASPESLVTKDSSTDLVKLLDTGELLYIRSGKQVRREGFLYIVLSFLNRFIKSRKIYKAMYTDCILKNQKNILLSVGITSYDTTEQVCTLLDSLKDEEAIILMFHSVINTNEIIKANDRWFWDNGKLIKLCEYLSKNDTFKVITTKEWVFKERYTFKE